MSRWRASAARKLLTTPENPAAHTDRPPPQSRRSRLSAQPLLPARKPPSFARSDHARRVRVAAPARIAFWDDQHVLAERWQVAPAERASIRRRLQVLGAPNRPPSLKLRLGHLSKDDIGHASGSVSSRAEEHRDESLVVETGRYRITGSLRLPRDGYRSRLTDYLNASERTFLPLTDVEVSPHDGEAPTERRAFVAVSVSHIVLAMPTDAEPGGD